MSAASKAAALASLPSPLQHLAVAVVAKPVCMTTLMLGLFTLALFLATGEAKESANEFQIPPAMDTFASYEDMQRYFDHRNQRSLRHIENPLKDSYLEAFNNHNEQELHRTKRSANEHKKLPQQPTLIRFEMADAVEPSEEVKELIRLYKSRELQQKEKYMETVPASSSKKQETFGKPIVKRAPVNNLKTFKHVNPPLPFNKHLARPKRSNRYNQPANFKVHYIPFQESDAREPDENTKMLIKRMRALEFDKINKDLLYPNPGTTLVVDPVSTTTSPATTTKKPVMKRLKYNKRKPKRNKRSAPEMIKFEISDAKDPDTSLKTFQKTKKTREAKDLKVEKNAKADQDQSSDTPANDQNAQATKRFFVYKEAPAKVKKSVSALPHDVQNVISHLIKGNNGGKAYVKYIPAQKMDYNNFKVAYQAPKGGQVLYGHGGGGGGGYGKYAAVQGKVQGPVVEKVQYVYHPVIVGGGGGGGHGGGAYKGGDGGGYGGGGGYHGGGGQEAGGEGGYGGGHEAGGGGEGYGVKYVAAGGGEGGHAGGYAAGGEGGHAGGYAAGGEGGHEAGGAGYGIKYVAIPAGGGHGGGYGGGEGGAGHGGGYAAAGDHGGGYALVHGGGLGAHASYGGYAGHAGGNEGHGGGGGYAGGHGQAAIAHPIVVADAGGKQAGGNEGGVGYEGYKGGGYAEADDGKGNGNEVIKAIPAPQFKAAEAAGQYETKYSVVPTVEQYTKTPTQEFKLKLYSPESLIAKAQLEAKDQAKAIEEQNKKAEAAIYAAGGGANGYGGGGGGKGYGGEGLGKGYGGEGGGGGGKGYGGEGGGYGLAKGYGGGGGGGKGYAGEGEGYVGGYGGGGHGGGGHGGGGHGGGGGGGGEAAGPVIKIEYHAPADSYKENYKEMPEFKQLSSLVGKSPEDQIHGLTYLLAKEMQNRLHLQQQHNYGGGGGGHGGGYGGGHGGGYGGGGGEAGAEEGAEGRPQDNKAPILFHPQEEAAGGGEGGGGGHGGGAHYQAIALGPGKFIGMAKSKQYIPVIEQGVAEELKAGGGGGGGKAGGGGGGEGGGGGKVAAPHSYLAYGLSPNYKGISGLKGGAPVVHQSEYGQHGGAAGGGAGFGHNALYEAGYEEAAAKLQSYASKYAFGYRIRDFNTGNDFGHKQNRDLHGVTRGQYHILLPDGRIQNVIYHADDTGFHADVSFETGH